MMCSKHKLKSTLPVHMALLLLLDAVKNKSTAITTNNADIVASPVGISLPFGAGDDEHR